MRRYLVFAIVTSSLFLSSLNFTGISVAFPVLVAEFETSLVLAGWVLSIYQLVAVGVVPIISRLSDTIGRRLSFMLCVVLFTIGSLLAALAPNIGWLIFARVIQAAGGGGFIPTASGIVSDEFPDKRQVAIGLFSTVLNLGAVVGPNIGGWLVESFGWPSVFWLNIPFGLAILFLSWRFLRADTRKVRSNDLDLVSAVTMIGFVFALMISLSLVGSRSWVAIVLLAALGLAFLAVFVRRASQNRGSAVVSMDILTGKPFLAANLYNFSIGATAGGLSALLPLYASSVYGLGVLGSGVIVTPRAIAMMVVSIVSSFLIMRWGYRRPIMIGTVGVAAGLFLLGLEMESVTVAGIGITAIFLMIAFSSVFGAALGLSLPASNNACIELMPDKVASITGLRQLFRGLGMAMSVTIGTLIIEASSSMARGFTIILVGGAAMTLLTIPAVLAMPRSPRPAKS